MGGGGGVNDCQDGLGHFFVHVQMGLPGWFVHFLAQFGDVEKQARKGTLSQTSEFYISFISSLLKECRSYVLVSDVMAFIRIEKIGSEKSAPLPCLFDRERAGQ